MYESPSGRRITLYVRNAGRGERRSRPRYARIGGVGVFGWVDGRLASGDIGRGELRRLTESVQRQGSNR
jgi:anti-sigma factor RsiW